MNGPETGLYMLSVLGRRRRKGIISSTPLRLEEYRICLEKIILVESLLSKHVQSVYLIRFHSKGSTRQQQSA